MFSSLIIAFTLSIDSLMASLAYGSKKIKISFLEIQIINLTCITILGISLMFGELIKNYLPDGLTNTLGFLILFILGIVKLLDSLIKILINRYIKSNRLNFKFILNIYAKPEKADLDHSRTISPLEAFSLALALSLDSLAIGFSAALTNFNILFLLITSFFINGMSIISGLYLGNKITKKIKFDLSWLAGVILIILALLQL